MKNNLKQVLKDNKITDINFAVGMGVSTVTVFNWKRAKNLNTKTMYEISEHLGIDVNSIFEL